MAAKPFPPLDPATTQPAYAINQKGF